MDMKSYNAHSQGQSLDITLMSMVV